MSQVYDRDWYAKKIADPDTQEPRSFTGGPLAAVDFTLDALYYGVAHENERRHKEHELRAVFALLDNLHGGDSFAGGQKPLDQTAWIEHLAFLWEAENIPAHLDPATSVNFRLDILKALATLPKSYRRAFIHRMDGYSLVEIASLMGYEREPKATEGWKSFVDSDGNRWWTQLESYPNEESAERVIRNCSKELREKTALDVPGKKKRQPRADAIPTHVIPDVEAEIQQIRSWRRREIARRAA